MILSILLSKLVRQTGYLLPGFVAAGLGLGALLHTSPAVAQSADDFFHTGAQSYITNNVASAREQVDRGLALFPDDPKLKQLDELLKQQQQNQQSKNQNQKK